MSSRLRCDSCDRQSLISASVRRKSLRSQESNFCDSSRIAASPRFSMSARMLSTVARILASSSARCAASRPRFRNFAIAASLTSLDRLRIDRRAGRAGQMQRRRGEEELVDAILRAILRQLLQIKDLTHRNADHRDHHPVPRLVGILRLVGPYFAAPGVGTDRRDVLFADPVAGLEGQPRRVAAGIAAPVLAFEAALLMAGAHDHEIALPYLDALLRRAVVELGIADGVAVVQRVHAFVAGDVEQ